MARNTSQRRGNLLPSPLALLGVGVLFILAGVAMALVFNGEDPVRAASSQARADAAPDFALPTLAGDDLALADYRGQVVLVNFWATWCPPCRAELPDLVSYYHDYAGRGFALIGVNEQESAAQVADYLAQNRLDFPVVLDATGRVMERYGVTGMPSSFLINREGQIVRMWTGMITRATLESAITPLLGS